MQTLRNWIMASSFLASKAVILGLWLLRVLFKSELISEVPFNFSPVFSRMRNLFMAKLMILVYFFFASFSFTLSLAK